MRKLALLLMVVAVPVLAQDAKPAAIIASIFDRHGNAPSAPLDQRVVVMENGKENKVTSAERLSNPILYAVMVDSSASADDDPMRRVLKALPDFFHRALRPQDKVTVIGFSEHATSEIEPTSDLESIRKALTNLRWQGKTALYDSVVEVCSHTLPKMSTANERRIVILLTDGEDSASRSHEDAALAAASKSHAVFFPIDIRFGLKMWAGEFVQQDFANETGGKFFQFGTNKDLQNALQEIQTLVGNQYRLQYPAPAETGKRSVLKIKIEGEPDLRVIAPKYRPD